MLRRLTTVLAFSSSGEQRLFSLVELLNGLHLGLIGRGLVRLNRFFRRRRPFLFVEEPDSLPSGPYIPGGSPALLLYVPHHLKSQLIDQISGGRGYYHAAVDCGEIDQPTGKAVMTESMPGSPVRRVFQDRYGARPSIRLSIEKMGIDAQSFCSCVQSRLGEPYDYLEAVTWGAVDDPARQICSNLAAQCLPEKLHQRFVALHRAGRLPPMSMSVHPEPGREKTHIFISPNAFAVYFQAPHGRRVTRPGTIVAPRPLPDADRRKSNRKLI